MVFIIYRRKSVNDMKIKTKLIISFCMILFIPLFLACITIWGFVAVQKKAMEENYGIQNADAYTITNSIHLLSRLTDEEVAEIEDFAANTPYKLGSHFYHQELNHRLKEKFSYLVVVRGEEVIFEGDFEGKHLVSDFPAAEWKDKENEIGMYVDSEDSALIKAIDFPYSEGIPARMYIITSTEGVIPEVHKMMWDAIISIIIILLLTACMMIVWIYRSMITPIRKLQGAAENIKEGNLDFTVETQGKDEISELCVAFEEMRIRLLQNATEKLENENENRILISNIAHDLKTPITAVKGYAEGIIDGVANTPERVDKYVKTIYTKASEMDTLINELTLYTKIDTNRIPYNFAKINVSDYFRDCTEEIVVDLEAKGMSLNYSNLVDSDVIIIADPEQLKRVINNIISNSVKYMSSTNGSILFRVTDVGDFVQVEIKDNGCGISKEDLPYIFDRFYRTDASRNSATGGSGIGLSIVKKIVEDHGGKIWANSHEGDGTAMYFVIRKFQEVE